MARYVVVVEVVEQDQAEPPWGGRGRGHWVRVFYEEVDVELP